MDTSISSISLDESKKAIESLLERDENHFCADCDEPNPTWVSVTWGCFVCDNCARAHRALGAHNSFLKSGKLEIFTQEQIDCLSLQGNIHANGILEYHVPDETQVPHGSSDKWQRRKTYIQKKYEDLSFIKLEGIEKKRVNRESLISIFEDDSFMPWADHFMRIIDVKIVSLSGLNKSKFSNSALYAHTKIGPQQWKTEVKEFQEETRFEENFVFSWNGQDEMLLKICDKQRKPLSKTVSEVRIQLTCLLNNERKIKGTFPLYTKSKKSAGSIELEISYLSLLD